MNKLVITVSLLILLQFSCKSKSDLISSKEVLNIETPTISGDWKHIFNPNDTRSDIDTTWYTNDHCFAKDSKGKWHAYGIIGHKPISPWTGENKFFHISADVFAQEKWEDHDYALRVKEGVERVLWAPHIFQEKGINYMFYNIGNLQKNAPHYASWGQLCMAQSQDMFNWTRHEFNPMFSDPGHARDSFVMKDKGIYYYYYTKTYNEVDVRSSVAVRTSPDLKHWSGSKIVHIQPLELDWAGDAESPFIVKRNGVFYLFICRAITDYNQTQVYWSTDPTNFPIENLVCQLPTHASEIIEVNQDEWYISNTGWDKKGLYIAKLKWLKSN